MTEMISSDEVDTAGLDYFPLTAHLFLIISHCFFSLKAQQLTTVLSHYKEKKKKTFFFMCSYANSRFLLLLALSS